MEDIKGVVSIWDDTFLWVIKIEPCFPVFRIVRHLQIMSIDMTKDTSMEDL